jgi:alpha-L-rhamnosidase
VPTPSAHGWPTAGTGGGWASAAATPTSTATGSLIAQLEIVHRDGTVTVVGTDTSWRTGQGPLLASGLLDGETYDAREEQTGSSPGFDDGDWSPVDIVDRDPATLVAPTGPPVRCTQEITPVLVTPLDGDRLLEDFGQNLVGRVRITVSGPAGHTVVFRHAEVLQDGELCVRPLRDAVSTDRYTLRGAAPETWEPRFTIHGFRYAEITGWRGGDPGRDIVARVHHTDMARTGWFECSNEQVNRLHENVVWSLRGNFVDLPTDCPQRDERLGRTGDIQVFAPTAAFLYDCHGMLASWLRDVAVEQHDDGTVPWYVPSIPGARSGRPPDRAPAGVTSWHSRRGTSAHMDAVLVRGDAPQPQLAAQIGRDKRRPHRQEQDPRGQMDESCCGKEVEQDGQGRGRCAGTSHRPRDR